MKRGAFRALSIVLAWLVGTAAFLSLAAFAVMGRDFMDPLLRWRTRAATRIESALQPPTAAEIAASRARDTATAQLTERSDAAPPEFIVAFLAGILIAAFVAFYITGRRRRAVR